MAFYNKGGTYEGGGERCWFNGIITSQKTVTIPKGSNNYYIGELNSVDIPCTGTYLLGLSGRGGGNVDWGADTARTFVQLSGGIESYMSAAGHEGHLECSTIFHAEGPTKAYAMLTCEGGVADTFTANTKMTAIRIG